jgi:nitric oxide reductase NorE protein
MRKYLFNGAVITAAIGLWTTIKSSKDGPRDWRIPLMWINAGISLALAVGAVFPILKMFEWIPEITAGLTPGTNLFFMYYYVMAGMHLCHVLLGLVIQSFVIRNLRSKKPKISFVETGATYWHMVDVLWLVLFALLYVMR